LKKKISILDVKKCKENKEKFTMVTGYDYTTATIINESSINMILVGDSLGMVMMGYDSTVPVTMEDMIHHIRAVVKGAPQTLIVGDMPFGSYNVSVEQAVVNANRLMKEGGCDCVKLEGGSEMAGVIHAIVRAGIPVMGHIGLTPQSISALGGFKVQGKSREAAEKLASDAIAIEAAGAFMVVVECVPAVVGKLITDSIKIPTMGIGAGVDCDCQVLILQDMMGMYADLAPKFVKKYASLREVMVEALENFHIEVRSKSFPTDEFSYATKIDGLE
jgi:3-methyl-2-oxobutanoate hydroxymethyltransferase